jgi:DNA transformation protein
MFALVLGETLYLKADAENLGGFERLGLAQLTYERQGREVGLSYYLAPADCYHGLK